MSKRQRHLYEFGRFTLDATNRLLLREGEPVPLHPKAFDTLLLLVENSGEVLGKDELVGRLWPDSFVEESNLSQNIYVLRKALGHGEDGREYIKTVPKRGYLFVADVREQNGSPAEEDSRTSTADDEEATSTDGTATEQTTDGTTRPIEPPVRGGGRRSISPMLIVAALAVGLSIAVFYWLTSRAKQTPTATIKSIAVLPFKPLAIDDRDESLELGIADTLITRLSVIRGVVVRPVSAVRRYTELEQDAVAAGSELKVEAVLDGSIQRAGERVRVTVRLVRVADGGMLWADKFDEKFTDIFAVQDQVSEQVTRSLALHLSSEERRQLAKRYTENTEAYQLYLKGRYFWNKRTEDGLRKGIEYFRQAIAQDPNYALAYSGMADSYALLSNYSDTAPKESFPAAKEAATRALELDDKLAEAHTSLARVKEAFEWDWAGAESGYRRALELNPGYTPAHHRLGLFLSMRGRFDEALTELEQARQLDPMSLVINADIGLAHYFARRYDQSVDQLLKTIEMDPNFAPARYYLAEVYVEKRMFDEAIAEAQKASELTGGRSGAVLSYSYAAAGRKEEAREVLKEVTTRAWVFQTIALAATYAELGDTDEAFARLEKGYEQRAFAMRRLGVDPSVDDLRRDPRSQDLMRRMGFPQ